jgi:hypothetical protein
MADTKLESTEKVGIEKPNPSSGARRRGRPRQQSFVKVETVSIERSALPDPRWMAEFVAAFLKVTR